MLLVLKAHESSIINYDLFYLQSKALNISIDAMLASLDEYCSLVDIVSMSCYIHSADVY